MTPGDRVHLAAASEVVSRLWETDEATHDHPVPARCDTCAFCSYDGDYGAVRTCDADVECEPEEEAAVAQAVDEWVGAGEVGPCPAWRSSQWNDPSALDEFVNFCASTGVSDEPDETLPPECP